MAALLASALHVLASLAKMCRRKVEIKLDVIIICWLSNNMPHQIERSIKESDGGRLKASLKSIDEI